jgi:phosphoglycolate phosphatase
MYQVLWDIDDTLICAGGVDVQVWLQVCSNLSGMTAGSIGTTPGRTAPQVLLDTLLLAGVEEARARELLPEALRMEEAGLLARQEELRTKGYALPGARTTLAALQATGEVVQCPVTGNSRANAVLKLRTFGLAPFLNFDVGAYGSDDSVRPNLVRLALQRAQEVLGADPERTDAVLVGDSSLDVDAGRQAGVRVVAVATGRTDAATLQAAGADAVLLDLKDTGVVIRTLLLTGHGLEGSGASLRGSDGGAAAGDGA